MTKTLVALLALALFLTSPLSLDAKKPPDDDDPAAAGELYGDLYVIERDGNGIPITRPFTYDDEGGTVEVDCKQPLAEDCSMLKLWGDCIEDDLCDFDPELHDACEVHDDDEEFVQEVSFGRASVARSQDFVIDSAYAEVLNTFKSASEISFDPAGRPMSISLEGEKTIDAPLGNLGLFREVMINGCLGSVIDEKVGEGGVVTEITVALDEQEAIDLLGPVAPTLVCPYDSNGDPITPDPAGVSVEDMMHATGFLAGALDKSDPFRLDELINIDTYLFINEWGYDQDKKNRNLTVDYFVFGDASGSFTYERGSRFPAEVTAELLVYNDADSFFIDPLLYLFDPVSTYTYDRVDLDSVNLTVCRAGLPYEVVCDSASAEEYDPDGGLYGCGGANWFAQAIEHSRKTIWYLHNWAPPELAN